MALQTEKAVHKQPAGGSSGRVVDKQPAGGSQGTVSSLKGSCWVEEIGAL